MTKILHCICLFALLNAATVPAAAAGAPMFDVPRLEHLKADGDPGDWGDRGFRVAVLTSAEGRVKPATDLDADFRLGWDERGLWVLVAVKDNVPAETDNEINLWEQDSIELFVATQPGSSEAYQFIISPGKDAKHSEVRRRLTDLRRDAGARPQLSAEVARAKTATGYMMEVLLPWSNLGITPKTGQEIGFQIYVNDSDGAGDRFQAVWFLRLGAHADTTAMHRVRLAPRPSRPVLAVAGGEYEAQGRTRISVHAVGELAGRKVEVKSGSQRLAQGNLSLRDGRASADLYMPWPPRGKPYKELTVGVDKSSAIAVNLPDADEMRARMVVDAEINFHPYVFSGTQFPPCDFEQPLLAKELIGSYQIKMTFYDKDYNPVTTAEKPGRYGAVIDIIPENGRPMRRFRTLFRQPGEFGEFQWWRYDADAAFQLPKETGIDAAVLREQARVMSGHLKWQFVSGLFRDWHSGPLLAGLAETRPGSGPARLAEDVFARDRQWWVGLKRKLYGTDRQFSKPFTCPHPINGTPAPVLREGTPVEAGMKPDTAERIEAVCRAWEADTDQAFAVCVARRGVIFFHKAYGQRDGKPMTLDTKSWMASITKLLSGTLMMMLVDEGLVDLDDRVDKFIPALRDVPVKKPLTIRHLYTHTNGLWGHWGDDLNDFEEIIAGYYPHLKVGERHSYNGAGYTLGGKVIESVTGESIPKFFKRHLLDPLGCANTDVIDTSGGSQSTALDIARIGQMLLNRGAYGNLRFFREETFQRMLPQSLTAVLGPDTNLEWGIGVTWFNEKGLGKGTFGHGAASAATLRIDPVHDLVIVITRNEAGRNFGKYHDQFINAIVEGLPTSAVE